MRVKLPPEFDEKSFIEIVEKNPILWNRKHEFYYDRFKVQNAWKQVILELKLDPELYIESVKEKWRGLRTTFAKKVSEAIKLKTESGSESIISIPKWRYFNHMLFLHSSANNHEMDTNLDYGAVGEEMVAESQDDDSTNKVIIQVLNENDNPQSSTPAPSTSSNIINENAISNVIINQSSQQDSFRSAPYPLLTKIKHQNSYECNVIISTLIQNEKELIKMLREQIDIAKQQCASKVQNEVDPDEVQLKNALSLILPLIRKLSDMEKFEYYQGLLQFTKEFYEKVLYMKKNYADCNE